MNIFSLTLRLITGPAGQICAETLRQEGFTGRLILISADAYPPYDRIKLSKQLDYTIDQIKLRPETFYKVWFCLKNTL